MGLSNALSGGIILFGITYVIFTFGGLTDTASSLTETSSQIADLENKLLKTAIKVDIKDQKKNESNFNIEITNENLEKLWEFDKFDVIINYYNSGVKYTETVSYDSTCPPVAGEWCVDSTTWIDDAIDPQILNYKEKVKFNVEANNTLEQGTTLVVIVSTPNGVVGTKTKNVA